MSNWQSDSFLLLLCHKISVLHHFIFAIPGRDEKGQKISFTQTVCTRTPLLLSTSTLGKRRVQRSRSSSGEEAFLSLARVQARSEGDHQLLLGHRFLFYPSHCWQNEGYLHKPLKECFIQSPSAPTHPRSGHSDKGRRHTEAPASHSSVQPTGRKLQQCGRNLSAILWNLFQRWK